VKDRVPDLSFKSFRAFTAGAAACETRRRHRTERTATLGWQIWNGRRSRIGDAARHKPQGSDNLRYPVVLAVRRERGLRRAVARRWAALMEIQESKRANNPRPLRLHRRHQHDDDPRRPGALQARSPRAMRSLVVRPYGRGRNLPRARAQGIGGQQQLCRVQDDCDRRRRFREVTMAPALAMSAPFISQIAVCPLVF